MTSPFRVGVPSRYFVKSTTFVDRSRAFVARS
jgi:hypothetical protein